MTTNINNIESNNNNNNNKEMYSSRDNNRIDKEFNRYPHCIVWTPIPLLTLVKN